jgi:hypothetical protein
VSGDARRPARSAQEVALPQRLLRLAFLALLAGGVVLWTRARQPRALPLEVDLAAALPGELREVDLIVTRGARLLARKDLRYGPGGAPQLLYEQVEASPGAAELEAELVYRDRPAVRARETLSLSPDAPARVAIPPVSSR